MSNNCPFIRSEIAQLKAYTPHPGGAVTQPLDRLDTNESPIDLPDEVKQKLVWLYQEEIETNRYPDGSHIILKEEIANYANESANLQDLITAAHISLGNGSDELIRSLLIATCLGGQGSILVANPTFSMYSILAQTLGIPTINVGRWETNFAIDLLAAEKAIDTSTNPPMRVVFVVHPNSPTGNTLTEEELDWLRNLPQEILVVIDEAYFEFSQTSVVGELATRSNWVILRTFSKAFRLASLRIGYAIADPELVTALEKVRLPYNLPSFSQTAALIALQHRHLILSNIEEILQERNRLWQAWSNEKNLQIWPSQANFLYLRLNSDITSPQLGEITEALKAQGTLIRHTGGGLRITIGTKEENNRTLQRLQKLINL